MLVFEGGEANRFNEDAIVAGTEGVMRVLAELGMRPPPRHGAGRRAATTFVRHTHWVRARRTGILRIVGQRRASGSSGARCSASSPTPSAAPGSR